MGAGNVSRVYKEWSCLEHRPFRALVYMALVSMDRDDPPKYWGGRDPIAAAIGYDMPEAPPDDDKSQEAAEARRARERGHKASDKVTQILVQQGALLRLRSGNFRSHAVFALLPPSTEAPHQGVATKAIPVIEVPPQGVPRSPLRGPIGPPSGVPEGPPHGGPKEYEEKEGGSKGMPDPPSAGPSPRPKLKTLLASSPDIEKERQRQTAALEEMMRQAGQQLPA